MDLAGTDAQEEDDQTLQHSAFEVLRDMPNPASDRVQKAQAARGVDPQQLVLQGVRAELCSWSCCSILCATVTGCYFCCRAPAGRLLPIRERGGQGISAATLGCLPSLLG